MILARSFERVVAAFHICLESGLLSRGEIVSHSEKSYWNGGRHTELRVSRVRCGRHPEDRYPSPVEVVRKLGGQWPDREVAADV